MRPIWSMYMIQPDMAKISYRCARLARAAVSALSNVSSIVIGNALSATLMPDSVALFVAICEA